MRSGRDVSRRFVVAVVSMLAMALLWLVWHWRSSDAGPTTPAPSASAAVASAPDLLVAPPERNAPTVLGHRQVLADGDALVSPIDTDRTCDVDLIALLTDGRPLAGVRYGLESWPAGERRVEGVSDEVGRCLLTVPYGRYRLDACHDHHGLLLGDHLPQRLIEVPAARILTTWIPAYVSGLQLVGAATFAGSDYVLFDPAEFEYESVESSSHQHVTDTLAKQRLPGWTGVLYSRVPPGERSMTIFDRQRGPCKVRIPAVFAGDYRGPLTVDLSAMPVVEPMCELQVAIQDCDGVPISDARISLARESRYAGVYSGGVVPANRVVYVPPGEYVVRYTSPVVGEVWIEKGVVITAGSRRILAWRSDYAMFDVELKVGRDGMLAVDPGRVSGFGCQPKRVAAGDSVHLSLPTGEFQASLLERAREASGFAVTKESFVVRPRREPQLQEIFRLQ